MTLDGDGYITAWTCPYTALHYRMCYNSNATTGGYWRMATFYAPYATSAYYGGFVYCAALTSLSLPLLAVCPANFITTCNALQTLSLPEAQSVTTYSIYNNTGLQAISMPKCTIVSGGYSFGGNSAATSITLGSVGYPVTTIGGTAPFNMAQATLTITLYITAGSPPSGTPPYGATNCFVTLMNAATGELISTTGYGSNA
jgi:hypothetical protein